MLKKILTKILGEKKAFQTLETVIIAVLIAALAVGAIGIIGNKVKSDAQTNTNTISTKVTNSINSLSQ
ncbi:MAG: hypothetical protein ACPLVF_02005 [Thermovenabulum sp.]|uniref:hypothetical protein n=1 Tax=Thermovenabulum sp. TaxID=3100335 RepID=UPI003C7D520B